MNIPQVNLQLQMTDNQMTSPNLKIFSLIRLKAECKILPARADFSTPHRPNATPTSIVPTFHNDGCYFTPAFLLPSDKKYYKENTTFQKCQFEEKVQRSAQQASNFQTSTSQQELIVSAPNSNYCQICQQKFQDYFAHVQLKGHQIRSLNVEATAMIHNLCQQFCLKIKNSCTFGKTKSITKVGRRQEKNLSEFFCNKTKKRSVKSIQVSLKGQNHSTCLPQDSQWQMIE